VVAPAAPGYFSLHAGDHPVDDGGPLELGEHPEHLNHHPTRSRGGVEGLGGRPEGHPSTVQVLQQLGEAPDGASEAVHPVDEQQVEAPGSGFGQCPLESWPLGGCSRGLVGEAAGQFPAVLAG